ncbi:MAG TPA: DUF4388 domain-containing protein [Actinomycetota bacterium]|nr:DUF4388 domain-containing protein [Actinomycetota bacterium]
MLTGTLDDFTLQDVLRLIGGARRTGGLDITRDGGAGSLFFRDGAVRSATPRYGRRTPASTPQGAIEDLTFDLVRWGRGDFTWTPGAATPAGAETSLDVDALLRDVSRRLEELAEIQTLVPSEEAVLTMAPQPPEGAVQINVTPAEWRVLVLVDGHRTVSEIAGAAHLDDLEAMKLLFGLAAAGLVTAGSSPAPAPAPAHETPSSEPASDMTDMTDMSAVSDTLPEDTFLPGAVEPAEEPNGHEVPAPAMAAFDLAPPAETPAPEPVRTAAPAPDPAEEPDPFLAELAMEPADAFGLVPPAPAEAHEAPAEAHEAPAVDRSTAARELAGLFDDVDPMQALGGMAFDGPPAPPKTPRRVEDDDQVTRGLISRLIDGVKGL